MIIMEKHHKGLSTAEAEKILKRDGENKLAEEKKSNPLAIFGGQFKDTMVLILLAATAVSVVMGEYWDALTITVIVILNAALGFIQEYRTEKTLEALKKFAAPQAQVYRDGKLISISAEKLVRGDILELEAGSRIPADCKILSAMSFECDEAMLTGESMPVTKKIGTNEGNILNQSSVCYMGTIATKGHATAEIIETGHSTQMGHISGMLTEIEEEKTPLQKKLGELGKIIGIGCVIICIIVSLIGILRGYAVFDMLFTGISLAVAAIPEGLPATVTISLALAIRRIYKQKALVNKLHSVETLGCTDVICTDKTGTLTQNKMTVTDIFVDDRHYTYKSSVGETGTTIKLLYTCGTVCNNAIRQIDGGYAGDPTETALRTSAESFGIRGDNYTRINEIPFDSGSRFMAVTVVGHNSERLEFMKGSPDVLIEKCRYILKNGEIKPFSPQDKKLVQAGIDQMTARALRLLGFAYKPSEYSDYIFIGLQGMSDPLRPEVRGSVKKCERAGIKVIMLTGDHKNTAAEIARQAGILKDNSEVITGAVLHAMSDDELQAVINRTSVFARVSPQDKLRIVRALKANGKTVAMTGDGVNDAPAVKEAAIGVAMGITGTDVTKEAAQIVLLDDNFATLVSAVEQGRTIYNNIRKFVRYMLSCNIGEVITMLVAMVLGMPVVLVPIQVLLINLVTDGLPAIALSMEPPTDDIMYLPPRKANESIFSGGMIPKIIFRGITIGICTLFTFMLVMNTEGPAQARTAAMATLGLSQLIFVFECKDNSKGIFNADYLNNKNLILAVLVSFSIIFCAMVSNIMSPIFQTSPLNMASILTVIGFSAGFSVIRGIFKLLK